MNFNEKLDFLMNITKTTNSALALYISLDASYISRLRRGERKLSKNQNYIKTMSVYFAKHCVEDYQKKAVCSRLNADISIVNSAAKLSQLINNWLLNEQSSDSKTVENFLDEISNFQFKKPEKIEINNKITQIPKSEASIYYGIEGKREAVIYFLSLIIEKDAPQTLYLFSDEDMSWLTENKKYMRKWAALMTEVIMKGSKIKIIHTVNRGLDEILSAINEWLPLYMTGAIEPYYYPKKRDRLFRRTLFIARETAAVVSTSVTAMAHRAANFLIRDNRAIEAHVEEFNSFLSLCRPLMGIFNYRNKQEYLNTLLNFEKESAQTIMKAEALSILTMPEAVLEKIASKIGNEQKNLLIDFYKTRTANFEKILNTNNFYEIIKLPDISSIKNGKVKIPFCHFFNNNDLYYTPEEFRLHLENILQLLKKHKNYHLCFSIDNSKDGYILYAKEDIGVIICKSDCSSVIFIINESNMTAAFWDFLVNKLSYPLEYNANRDKAINKLQSIIDKLN